jgi:hypothetical protein
MLHIESRYIGMVDIPETQNIESRFVYNFFVPDERSNTTGNKSFHGIKNENTQKLIDTRVLEARLPRYIEVIFEPVNISEGNIGDLDNNSLLNEFNFKPFLNSEETITSAKDCSFRYSDSNVRSRLTFKAKMLLEISEADMNDISSQLETIQKLDKDIDKEKLQEVLSPESTPGVEYVNDVGEISVPKVFDLASSLNLNSLLDRRVLTTLLSGDYAKESIFKTENKKIAQDDNTFLSKVGNDSSESFEPSFKTISVEDKSDNSDLVSRLTVGYLLNRVEISESGKFVSKKQFVLDNKNFTSYLDTEIAYGNTYTYAVQTVVLMSMVVPCPGTEEGIGTPGFKKILALVASRDSKKTIVSAVERVPPLEPDGIFYRYSYDTVGLAIKWQIPVGKQKDVKYYQIFKRKSINEPFTCIAELDFDNSDIVSTKRESVNKSNVFKFGSSITYYVDPFFKKENSFIYTVVAVDAHGLTSGYGVQTQVTFDKTRNTIKLKNISRAGAPKQYPNFYIDPDLDSNIFVDSLTQDAMFTSHKKKMKIYFDPDAVQYKNNIGDSGIIIKTKIEGGEYRLHLLNVDRQKSSTIKIEVDNLGST